MNGEVNGFVVDFNCGVKYVFRNNVSVNTLPMSSRKSLIKGFNFLIFASNDSDKNAFKIIIYLDLIGRYETRY